MYTVDLLRTAPSFIGNYGASLAVYTASRQGIILILRQRKDVAYIFIYAYVGQCRICLEVLNCSIKRPVVCEVIWFRSGFAGVADKM